MKALKIVITGITSFRNRGVEALVGCTIRALRGKLPGASYTVLDRAPEFDAPRLPGKDVKFMRDGTLRGLHSGKLRRLAVALAPALDHETRRARREIAGADAVVASGGDVFCSEYGHRSLLGHLEPLRIARRHQVPFFLHAQSIGPFGSAADLRAFVETARHASGISVRERASLEYVTGILELPPGKITHVADPAFLLSPGGPEGEQLFSHLRARPDRPTVALSISQAICQWMGKDADRHVDTWLEIIGWLRRELDANVILIPHVQETADGNNDGVLATAILRRNGWDPRVRLAEGDLSAVDFKAVLSRCDFIIAERMHAGIAGLSSGVPVLVIGYSVKAEGILTDLLGADLTRSRALISIDEFLRPGAAPARVRDAWHSRGELRAALSPSLPAARERASGACDAISALLSKKS
ncbi:MAG: polysaccharide pyruvyl transferase family protein [Verrucomicrobiota bacterium]